MAVVETAVFVLWQKAWRIFRNQEGAYNYYVRGSLKLGMIYWIATELVCNNSIR